MTNFAKFRNFEDRTRLYFRDKVFTNCLKGTDDAKIIEILAHRRYISNRFPLFCDTIYPLLESAGARSVAEEIMAEEYATINHREALVRELESLGLSKSYLRTFPYSEATNIAGENIEEFAHKCVQNGDLYSICSLRFFSEILAGEEFTFFLKTLYGEGSGRNLRDSVFLQPHVDYDIGATSDDKTCHADRYLPYIRELLTDNKCEESLKIAKDAITESLIVRGSFYEQFCPDIKIRVIDLFE